MIRNFSLYYMFFAIYPLTFFQQLEHEDNASGILILLLVTVWSVINLFLYLFHKNKQRLEERLLTHGFYLMIGFLLFGIWVIYEELTPVLLPAVYLTFSVIFKKKPSQQAERLFVRSGTISVVLTFLFYGMQYFPEFYDDMAELINTAIFFVIWAVVHLAAMIFIKVSKQTLKYTAIILGLAIMAAVIPYSLPMDNPDYFKYYRLIPLFFIPVFQWFFEVTVKDHLVKGNLFLRKTILIPVVGFPLAVTGFLIFFIVLFSSGFVPGP